MGNVNSDDIASKTDEMRHVLSEVNAVKGRQDSLTSKLESLKLLVFTVVNSILHSHNILHLKPSCPWAFGQVLK